MPKRNDAQESNPPDAEPHNVLISYHYCKSRGVQDLKSTFWKSYPRVRVFADSGGFSAWTLGKPIDIGAYAEWLKENNPHLSAYANLDVIGDAVGTRKNQRDLEARGLSPVPIFHFGTDFDSLRGMIEDGYGYICLGGMVGRPRPALMRFAIRCFKIAREMDRGTVFHGFGLTAPLLITSLPWYSVDSTTWVNLDRFGNIPIFIPGRDTMPQIAMKDMRKISKYARDLAAIGTNVAEVMQHEGSARDAAFFACAKSFLAMEAWARLRHGPIKRPDGRGRDGLILYFAGAEGSTVEPLSRAMARLNGG
jgi:hypothetical protein